MVNDRVGRLAPAQRFARMAAGRALPQLLARGGFFNPSLDDGLPLLLLLSQRRRSNWR